jgi:hypothetical protein
MVRTERDRVTLLVVKTVHTVVWVFFVACIAALPVLTWQGRFGWAGVFVGVVMIEVLVLAFNRWSCPLNPVAARLTEDRRANYAIFLPEWIARHNKVVFGALYVAGIVYLVLAWTVLAR